jgi:hypothetical protein
MHGNVDNVISYILLDKNWGIQFTIDSTAEVGLHGGYECRYQSET